MRKFLMLAMAIVISILASNPLFAQMAEVPSYISYQGHLTDSGGINLNGDVRVEVRLYDSLIAGMGQGVTNPHVVYAENHPSVSVDGGNFRISIGRGTPLDAKWSALPVVDLIGKENVYLELWANGERLEPRQRMGSVPAVLRAKYAKYADGLTNLPEITAEMMPSYNAERISGTLTAARIPGLSTSNFTGTLTQNHLPTLAPAKFSTSGTLPTAIFEGLDASLIGGGVLSMSRLSETLLETGEIALSAGTLNDEQMLTFPSGFSESECAWSISFSRTVSGSVQGINYMKVLLNGDRVLSCEYNEEGKSCSANYVMICKKGGV